ncbi:aKG-HExxH-type peptide beta-hydroxylase [Streptomyces apocyni]|uniref:aKG-HExxH-type peptide beta-hydroxylase n=1 Tax=Streptomyces apocyni TaxID=2654677 RepID=UPI0012EA2BED|nr:HEXXH motif-containing putative peptide modification protein [Streptomyces apocyni]
MTAVVPARVLRELGRTEGGPEALRLLVHDQHTRRLLLLRAVLDAAEAAPEAVCPRRDLRRLRADWALLEAAERAGDSGRSVVRSLLLHPLLGPWAKRCLTGLTGPARTPELAWDLAHFSAVAAAAATRARVPFTVPLTAYDGLLALPTLGALRTGSRAPVAVDASLGRTALTLRRRGAAPVRVYPQADYGAWSTAPAWAPLHSLTGVTADSAPVPLDDLDPYRAIQTQPRPARLSEVNTLTDATRKQWLNAWSGTAELLALSGPHRTAEAAALLRCLVPLAAPPGAGPVGRDGPAGTDGTAGTNGPTDGPAGPVGSCSATRREAFGAVLSTTPATTALFAATLVHELQHAKLAALSDLLPLHHADATARYFAPWRPDPRPFDGLWQGAYSHLALADYWQRLALATHHVPLRDQAWAAHARCREQVGAALPALVGSPDLTPDGRRFADAMVGAYTRLLRNPPPKGQLARATAYVSTARSLWHQRHGPFRR